VLSAALGSAVVLASFVINRAFAPELVLSGASLVPVAAVAWITGFEVALVVGVVATVLASVASTHPSVLVGVALPAVLNMGTAWGMGWLRHAYVRERRLARTDTVTGAPNRLSFSERARDLLRRSARSGTVLTAVSIDLDGFKRVNDQLGHDEGDEVLRAVATTISRTVRATDVVARLGGDEFAILLVDADPRQAPALLDRLRGALDGAMAERGWPVTFSIGALTFAGTPPTERELLRLVDQQMYQAKHAGKDRLIHTVHGAHPEV
jgi:diguanylate cyclase (GGDEF)-like protein